VSPVYFSFLYNFTVSFGYRIFLLYARNLKVQSIIRQICMGHTDETRARYFLCVCAVQCGKHREGVRCMEALGPNRCSRL